MLGDWPGFYAVNVFSEAFVYAKLFKRLDVLFLASLLRVGFIGGLNFGNSIGMGFMFVL